MSDLKVYSYSRCTTCRKALAWLKAQGFIAEVVDITILPPDRQTLVDALQQFGQVKHLFNTSGQSYRAMGAAVVKAMSDEQALDALAKDGRLIKRPFLLTSVGQILVGFKPDQWSQLLKG